MIYYLKNSGKLVATKDSADYSMVAFPPDTNVDKSLFVVCEYYKNGKPRLITKSKTNDLNLKYYGQFISFFSNGRKKSTGVFDDGKPVGHVISYFPNGKVYNTINYYPDNKILYGDCRDSTGKILAENGTGYWIQYDDDFKNVVLEGKIDSGYRVGTWHIRESDSLKTANEYDKGSLKSTRYFYKGDTSAYSKIDSIPEFPGGMEAFGKFLGHNLRYPAYSREHGTQGRVVVGFIVEVNGTLSNIRIVRKLDDHLDQEALRVMKLSPNWKPGIFKGKPVRVNYSIPISFTLSN